MLAQAFSLPDSRLGVAEIDASHSHLLAALDALAVADDSSFEHCFASALASLEADFRAEEVRMEEIGFPGLQAHRAQHGRMLGGLHEAQQAMNAGNAEAGRCAVRMLPQWMRFHIWTMDSALIAALRQTSGAQDERPRAPAGTATLALTARLQVMRMQLVERIHEQLCLAEGRAACADHSGELPLMSNTADDLATAMLERDLASLADVEAALRGTRD